MNLLEKTIEQIRPVNHNLEKEIRLHLNDLTKPVGSLGYLEELAVRYCLATNTTTPAMGKKEIFTFAGDHGVAAEGVSAFPMEVTPQMVINMLHGGAAVNVLARHADVEVKVIDIGVADPLENAQGLIQKKIRPGTGNIAKGPAMTLKEATHAIEIGIELAQKSATQGVTLIGTGEMGIGNTTPSSAIFSVLLPCNVADVTGRGTGITGDTLKHKVEIIEQSLEVNKKYLTDPLNILAAVGGLEIAGICGLILGAVSRQVPVVIDGFISTAGALVACKMCSHIENYLFFSHQSAEAGHRLFFDHYGFRPILALDMRLGEGTGAALAMSIIEASIKIYNEMATFDSAGVSKEGA